MPLCNLCKNIPWENLPTVPPNLPCGLSGHPYIQAFFEWPWDMRGYPHHQSLSALRESASSCDLCSITRKSAENVQKELEELQPKWEAGEMTQYDWPTWEMWLVKRLKGGDGCWVMSFVSGDRGASKAKEFGEAWIIAALGICVEDNDPLASVIAGRPVEETGGTPTAIARARKWLNECNEHPTCNPGETYLPSRVIDVGPPDSPEVHLWEPVPEGTVGKYISLSYCWGSSREFVTTRSTIEERKTGIAITDMPATYQDIVTLTRELGIRYLWVDSLCICQDEHDDWERESAKMLSIYSNSYVTVAAFRAKESAEGFFGPRPERTYVHLNYSRNDLQGTAMAFALPLREELIKEDYITLPQEPLSKRAWSLQERMLSHRVLIYGTSQMFYECNEGYRGEDGLFLTERHDCVHKSLEVDMSGPSRRLEGLKPNIKAKLGLLRGWYNIVGLYGPRALSHASDKLPAISGIASLYAERIGEDYLAGLWREQLLEGLLWQGLGFRRVPKYRAPSWSWASGDGFPATGLYAEYDELAEILDAHVTLKGTNPFGEVTDGWIKIRAPLEQLFLVLDGWDPEAPGHYPYDNNVKVRTAKGTPEGKHSRFDFAFRAEDAGREAKRIVDSLEGVDIFALVLIKSHPSRAATASNDGTYHSLIVKKVDGTDNYQRLGCLLCGNEFLGREPEEQPKEELLTYTLV